MMFSIANLVRDAAKRGRQVGIQVVFPCENPESNVRMEVRKGMPLFLVPSNHPLLRQLTLPELIDAAKEHPLIRIVDRH